MSHLLWGADWDDPELLPDGPKAVWDPIFTTNDPITNNDREPWLPKMDNCAKEDAYGMCLMKAESICNVTFIEGFNKVRGSDGWSEATAKALYRLPT